MNAPRLQLALDTYDFPSAIGPAQHAAAHVDIMEVGTVLCLAEGMSAVRSIRAAYPGHTVLADLRIAEAGSLLAKMGFEAGANWVSVVAGASMTTVETVVKEAANWAGEVQIELGEAWTPEQARRWREAGVEHVIVHRSRDGEAGGVLRWTAEDLDGIDALADLGFQVTATGGITSEGLSDLAPRRLSVVIAGRAILKADAPGAAAAEIRQRLAELW